MKQLLILFIFVPLLPIIGIVWAMLIRMEKIANYNQYNHVSK